MISLGISTGPAPPKAASREHYDYDLGVPAEYAEDARWSTGDLANQIQIGGTPQNPAERRALNLSCVWRGTQVVSNTLAMLEARVKRRLPEGGAEVVEGHQVARVLRRPMRSRTGFSMRQTLGKHLVLRGNAYLRIMSGRMGWATGLRLLHPDRVLPYDQRPDGRLTYLYFHPEGGREWLTEGDDILHLRGMSDDGLVGLSVIAMMRRAVETATQQEEYGRRFFRQAPAMRGIIKVPYRLTAEDRQSFERSFARLSAGRQNWFATPVLERGMEWQNIGITNEDSQWLESRAFSVPDFARWIGVPTVLLMHTDRSSLYANAGKFFESFARFDQAHWIVALEQQFTDNLLTEAERDRGLFVDLDASGMMRGDVAARTAYYRTMVEIRAMSRNEVRMAEGMNPVEGGDTFDPPRMGGAPPMPGGPGRKNPDRETMPGDDTDDSDDADDADDAE